MPENTPANSPYKPLTLDLAKYRCRLDAFGLTDAQKDEYIHALWLMVVSFADLNMPSLFEDTCGQACARADAVPDASAAVLHSTQPKTAKRFTEAANFATPPNSKKEAS